MRYQPLLSAVALAATTPLIAQGIVLPPAATSADARANGPLAGASISGRQQFLLGAGRLAPIAGSTISSIAFRRDSAFRAALNGGGGTVTISLSTIAKAPLSASPVFAENRGSRVVQVYSGPITIPPSAALTGNATASWNSSDTIVIPFTTSFDYSGGTLCVEIDGRQVATQESDFWPIDHDYEDAGGTAQVVGSGCGRFASPFPETASAWGNLLRIGSTLRLTTMGQPGTPAILLLGATRRQLPAPLAFLGAPGCGLYIDAPAITLTTTLNTPAQPGRPGFGNLRLQLPVDGALQGASLYAQWADIEIALPAAQWSNAAGITTTNALDLTISAIPSTLDGAVVLARTTTTGSFPATGDVRVDIVPVVRLQ